LLAALSSSSAAIARLSQHACCHWRHPRAVRGARSAPLQCEMPSFEVELTKPLGLALEECGRGIEVAKVLEGGSAFHNGQLWQGDLVLEVNGVSTRDASFESTMDLLASSPTRCRLLLGRVRGKVTAVVLPDGQLAFTRPGSAMMDFADSNGISCEYSCMQGTCGSCTLFLKDNEDESVRPVLICKAQFPTGSQASLMPYELLPKDGQEAQRYNEDLEAKVAQV